jgi:hypothetical protein
LLRFTSYYYNLIKLIKGNHVRKTKKVCEEKSLKKNLFESSPMSKEGKYNRTYFAISLLKEASMKPLTRIRFLTIS